MRRCTIAAVERPAPRRTTAGPRSGRGTGLATRQLAVRIGTIAVLVLMARLAAAEPMVLVRAGDPSPLGLPFSHFSDAVLDERGQVAFVGGSTVLFSRSGDGIASVTGAGSTLLGRTLAGVGPPVVGTDGCLAFRAAFVGGGAGIFRRCGGTFELIADVGLGVAGGRRIAGLADQVASAGGRVAFLAVLDDASTGIYVADGSGTLTEVARTGGPSPAGGTFSGLRLVGIAASGRVGFRASASGGRDGLFYWDGSSLLKLVVVGDPATPTGGTFTTLGLATLNDADTWTFRAEVSEESRSGVFRATTSSFLPIVTKVALEGEPTPIGGIFQDFPTALIPVINPAGQIAFRAIVDGAPYSSGVFLAGSDGMLTKVVAVGEPTPAGQLVRLREVALADDGGVVVRASLSGGTPGLFRARGGRVEPLVLLGDPTDLGDGFRFSDPAVRGSADDAIFIGVREGLFLSAAPGDLRPVALLGEKTPLGGHFAGIDPPAGGGKRVVFGAGIQAGRTGEALFLAGERRPRALARVGSRIKGCGQIADIFSNPLDDLARPAAAPGSVAFQTALAGGGAASGIILWSGGGLRAIACEGRHAPGGGSYHQFGTPAAGKGGQVAFVALARASGGTLFQGSRTRMRAVASGGVDTGTRLEGTFRGFDTPNASGASVAFRAVLNQAREGIFVARGRCLMALAGSGESAPGGGRFRTFGAPAFTGSSVVFRATVLDGTAPTALYRAAPSETCTQIAPSIETIAAVSSPSPVGSPYLAFGTPAGNRQGAITVTADLTGNGPIDTIILIR